MALNSADLLLIEEVCRAHSNGRDLGKSIAGYTKGEASGWVVDGFKKAVEDHAEEYWVSTHPDASERDVKRNVYQIAKRIEKYFLEACGEIKKQAHIKERAEKLKVSEASARLSLKNEEKEKREFLREVRAKEAAEKKVAQKREAAAKIKRRSSGAQEHMEEDEIQADDLAPASTEEEQVAAFNFFIEAGKAGLEDSSCRASKVEEVGRVLRSLRF